MLSQEGRAGTELVDSNDNASLAARRPGSDKPGCRLSQAPPPASRKVVTLKNRVRQLVWGSKRAASASEVAIFGFGPGKREGQRLMAQSQRASDASLNSWADCFLWMDDLCSTPR